MSDIVIKETKEEIKKSRRDSTLSWYIWEKARRGKRAIRATQDSVRLTWWKIETKFRKSRYVDAKTDENASKRVGRYYWEMD